MRSRLRSWWENFPLGEAATLAFWNFALIAFVGGAAWLAKGIIEKEKGPECAEYYRVTDPRINAVLFLERLQEEGLFDPKTDNIKDFAWVSEGGKLRFMVALDTGVYSAIACYTEDQAIFQDLRVE
jgi:hypothetical protein